jgi:phosphoenolpyruvate carboxylase
MTKARTKVLNGTALLIKRRKPMRANNVDKPLESAPTVDEALKVAKKEKDPMNHIDLELMNRLNKHSKKQKKMGSKVLTVIF